MKKTLSLSFIIAFAIFFAFPKEALAAGSLVGAIRWDSWSAPGGLPNGSMQRFLPSQFHYRLPFYAYIRNGIVDMSEDKQEIIDREINYADSAGISYWLFDWYEPNHSMGRYAFPLHLYLTSPNKAKLNFALMFMRGSMGKKENWRTETVPLFLQYVTKPTYQKIKINGVERPMIFFYQPVGLDTFFGGVDAARNQISYLRTEVSRVTGRNPYIIGLTTVGNMSKLKELGFFNAGSTYLVGPAPSGQSISYAKLLSTLQNYYQETRFSPLPFLTPATIGINDEPRGGSTIVGHVDEGTLGEITQMISNAAAFSAQYSPANSILVYAWNELSEGGWLMPGLTLGDKHLRALAAGLGHSFPVPLSASAERVGNTFKLTITATTGSLPSGATIQFYDQGSVLWGSRRTVARPGSRKYTVTLPDLLPPSQCNSQDPCRLNADIYANGNYYSFISFLLPKSAAPAPIPGDLNSDGKVNVFDYNILVAGYGTTYSITDYNNVVENFGK